MSIRGVNDLLKRQETCKNIGGCLGFVLRNYYVNARLLLLFLYLL